DLRLWDHFGDLGYRPNSVMANLLTSPDLSSWGDLELDWYIPRVEPGEAFMVQFTVHQTCFPTFPWCPLMMATRF
ncbi:MAG: hypothetical protein ACOCSO_02990, partial [Thermoplasmatota archaeon]